MCIIAMMPRTKHRLDNPYIHLNQISGAITLNRFLLVLFVFSATIIITAIISVTHIAPQLSAYAQDTDQDSSQLSAQITQAQEDIRKELAEQGQIISNNIKEQFGFE